MTRQDDQNLENFEELQEEIDNLEEAENQNEDEILEEDNEANSSEIESLKEQLLKTQADYQNFKMRSERDRQDMIFFLKEDIFKKILPRVDDLERIIKNTPEAEQSGAIYEWIMILYKSLLKDLENMWVVAYESIGQEVDPNKHEVMTQIPSETPWIIIDQFEKWYMLWEKVLRVAKVIVWT